jgi:hypothetical protein
MAAKPAAGSTYRLAAGKQENGNLSLGVSDI